eukprot:5460558-Amphidinium_carterae.1
MKDSRHVYALTKDRARLSLCLDSGAEEHCAPHEVLHQHGRKVSDDVPILRGANGQRLKTHGLYELLYEARSSSGQMLRMASYFVACDVDKLIMNVDKLHAAGIDCVFSRRNPRMIIGDADVHMRREGRSFFVSVEVDNRVSNNKLVCVAYSGGAVSSTDVPSEVQPQVSEGVAVEGKPESTSERVGDQAMPPVLPELLPETAKVGQIRDRLRQLGAPIYGTKTELRVRLLEWEIVVDRKRKERAWAAERASDLARKSDPVELREVPIPPGLPSPEEIQRHRDAQHLPAAPWCQVCIKARSVAKAHRRFQPDLEQIPRFELDYNFYTQGLDLILSKDGEPVQEAFATTLTCVDKMSGNLIHLAVERKGVVNYSVASCASFILRGAYKECELLTDGEVAIVALGEAIKAKVLEKSVKLHLRVAPRYASQTMGAVGVMQDICAKQLRCLREDFQERYNLELTPSHCLWPWLVRHNGWCIEHLHVRGTLTTAYQDTYGVAYRGPVVPFGETCLFRLAYPTHRKFKQVKVGKADLRFLPGLFVGKAYESDEWLVLTQSGCFANRTLKRLPREQQTNHELVVSVRGVPWDPEGQRLPPPRPPAQPPQVRGPEVGEVVEAKETQGPVIVAADRGDVAEDVANHPETMAVESEQSAGSSPHSDEKVSG